MTKLHCTECGKDFTEVEKFNSHVHRMSWWQRFKAWLNKSFVVQEPDASIFDAFDQYYDGHISYDTYRERAERAMKAYAEKQSVLVHDDGTTSLVPCDDCHRTDGTHDLTVEH